MAEIEYQVDELLFKMNAMSHEHSLPEKCHSYLDDSDGTHGHGDDTMSCSSSEVSALDFLFGIYIFNSKVYVVYIQHQELYTQNA